MVDPIPGIGRKRYHRPHQKGVSASSRILAHFYADEGIKGRAVRRLVRRREERQWLKEIREER